MIDYDKEIYCAAIKAPDGRVWTGHRHPDCIKTIVQATGVKQVGEGYTQGFITKARRFVDREEALMIAVLANQVKQYKVGQTELYSEDLY